MKPTLQGSSIIVDLGSVRWALHGEGQDGDVLTRLRAQDRVRGPLIQVSDFDGALQGVEQVTASRRYADAIIEKLLRDRGDAEGTSKVLVLDSETRAGATRALYHAVPTDRFEEYRLEASGHRDHHLQLSHLSLLLQLARRQKERVVCVLFQHALDIDVLLVVEGSARACFRVTASGPEVDDWQRALGFLAQELRTLQTRLEISIESTLWVDWNPDLAIDTDMLVATLRERTGLEMTRAPSVALVYEQRTFRTSLPPLLQDAPVTRAVNPPVDLALYAAERLLPYAALVMLGISVALALVAYQWQGQAQAHERTLASMQSELRQMNLEQIRADIRQAAPLPAADIRFVGRMADAATMPSLAVVVADIRDVLPTTSRLTRLALQRDNAGTRLIMEGWVDADPDAMNVSVERIISALSSLGHAVSDNGLMSRQQRNLFQLELDLEEYTGEV